MKKILLGALAVVLLQACSEKNEVSLSKEGCEAIGGTLTDGQCYSDKEFGADEMKKICEAEGTEYSAEHNGCFLGEDEMRITCKEMGMKYSEEHNGCME